MAINLSRNHGHQLALTAGLDLCRGEIILIIDADLQDPPELLLAMLEAEGADVVYGLRRSRAGESVSKKLSAAIFYWLLDRLTDINILLDTGDFRLMTRRGLNALLSLPEQARFIRGMVAWIGFKQLPFPYDRAERHSGETNYLFSKMLRLAFDAVTGFSTAPLRLATHAGLVLSGLALLLAAWFVVVWVRGETIPGWTSLILIVLGLGAAEMFVLGLIGEYLGRLYVEAKRRPLYLVADVLCEQDPREGGSAPLHQADGEALWQSQGHRHRPAALLRRCHEGDRKRRHPSDRPVAQQPRREFASAVSTKRASDVAVPTNAHAAKFSSVHASIHNHFNQERHLVSRIIYKDRRSAALAEWRAVMG